MTTGTTDEVRALCERLADKCRNAGLNADVLSSTRVRVSAPRANRHLAEIIRCMPDTQEELCWWWSWGERICPAADIDRAAHCIAHVVAPAEPGVR